MTIAILGVLATIAISSYSKYMDRAKIAQVVFQMGSLDPMLAQYELDTGALPVSLANIGAGGMLDPWGRPYGYISHDNQKGKGQWRKDHNIVPINSDYDLWSNGKDGQSLPPLTAKPSRDDIVRASNGRFIGLASEFDP